MDTLNVILILLVMVLIAINVYLYCRMMRYWRALRKTTNALTSLIWKAAFKKKV